MSHGVLQSHLGGTHGIAHYTGRHIVLHRTVPPTLRGPAGRTDTLDPMHRTAPHLRGGRSRTYHPLEERMLIITMCRVCGVTVATPTTTRHVPHDGCRGWESYIHTLHEFPVISVRVVLKYYNEG